MTAELVPVSVDTPAGTPVVVKIPQVGELRGVLGFRASDGTADVRWPDGSADTFKGHRVFVERVSWRPTEFGQRFTAHGRFGYAEACEFIYVGDNWAHREIVTSGATPHAHVVRVDDLKDFEPVPVPIPPVVDERLAKLDAKYEHMGFSDLSGVRYSLAEVRARLRKEAGR